MPVIHDLNKAFQLADDAWSAELIRVFKKQAGDARYDERGTSTDMLKALYTEVKRTGDLWRNAVAGFRNNKQFTVNVIGQTWGGFQSAYTYHMTQAQMPTETEVRRKAGDFEHVSDWQIISSETTVTMEGNSTTITTHRETIARPWFDEESSFTFDDVMVAND